MKMKSENWRFIVEVVAILLVTLLVLGVAACNHYEQARTAVEFDEEQPGEPLYRITYYMLEDGSVYSVLENLSDYDLTITFPDSYGYPETGITPSLPADWDWGGTPDEA